MSKHEIVRQSSRNDHGEAFCNTEPYSYISPSKYIKVKLHQINQVHYRRYKCKTQKNITTIYNQY